MGFLDAFIVLGLFFVGLPVAGALGWALGRITGSRLLARLPVFAVLIAVVFGVPLSLRLAGVATSGRVVAHHERVELARIDGAWMTSQWLRVRFVPAHAGLADPTMRDPSSDSVTLELRSTAAMYDRTPVGATVPVTYVSFRPSLAKLTERTTGDLCQELFAIGGVRPAVALFAALLLAALLSRWRPTRPTARRVRRAGLVASGGAAVVAGMRMLLGSPVHGPDDAMPASAVASVESFTTITRGRCLLCGKHKTAPLNQPYQVVTLSFTPRGAGWPVRTADAIDSGSVGALRDGATLAVRYAPAIPRHARIAGGRRTFETRNGRDALWETVLTAAGLLVVYLAGARVLSRLRRRPTAA